METSRKSVGSWRFTRSAFIRKTWKRPGYPNKKVCPQIFEKKKKNLWANFSFPASFLHQSYSKQIQLKVSIFFIFMFSHKQMFSPVCPIRIKKIKINSNFSNRLLSSPLFFSFLIFGPTIEKLPSPREMLWFLGVFVLFGFSLSRQMEAGATKQMFWCEILFLFFATFNGGKIAVCPNNPPSPNNHTLCDYSTLQKP